MNNSLTSFANASPAAVPTTLAAEAECNDAHQNNPPTDQICGIPIPEIGKDCTQPPSKALKIIGVGRLTHGRDVNSLDDLKAIVVDCLVVRRERSP